MSFRFEYLQEPTLQFGEYFEHEDAKTGLAEFGPFGKNIDGLHPSQIRLGFIGTRETVSDCKDWIATCGAPIESKNVKSVASRTQESSLGLFGDLEGEQERALRYEKILNRDFVGFNEQSPFGSSFQTNERWDKTIPAQEVQAILKAKDKEQRIRKLVDLFDANVKTLAETGPSPDIIILALTPEIVEEAHSVRLLGNFHLNLRRAIKARSMRWGIPIQLLQRRTILGKGADLQEGATRAWNFCTAQYYKADGVPWRPTTLERNTCFIGVSFYMATDSKGKLGMRASVAQAFDYLGQGLVLRGDPFEWDEEKMGRSPHLPRDAARSLIKRTLEEYVRVNRNVPPGRVVIHKTSEYWDSRHSGYDEVEGFLEGIQEVNAKADTDLLAVRQTGIRLFREGKYPPLRGTFFSVEDQMYFLYTMGYIPFLETYPGSYVPEPWQITDHHGSSSPKDLFKEILALTKMNVNNCSFADGTPITLSFSQKIGEIMRHIPEDGKVQPAYKFYM